MEIRDLNEFRERPEIRRASARRRPLKRVTAATMGLALVASGYVVRWPDRAPPAQPTEDSRAGEYYARGRMLLEGDSGVREVRLAEDLFERAVARDSGFAEAYAMLAIVRAVLTSEFGYATERAGALEAAERATELAPRSHLARQARRMSRRLQ